MDSTWLSQGGRVESYVFLGALLFFALIETLFPLRIPKLSTPRRWLNHGVLFSVNTALNILLFRGGSVAFAILIGTKGYGFLNLFSPPYLIRFAIGFVAVDLVHYVSHYIYHRVPFLWRIHRVHHTDPDFDVTTGFRFHPFESLATQFCMFAAIALIGPPALAVLAAEVVTLFQDAFEHANIEIPRPLDRILRIFLISPNLHRIHHSALVAEQNRNFGTIFPWWDRAFGTYAAESSVEPRTMALGLAGYPDAHSSSIVRTLTMPFEP
jgi:sterol desaturase/sphingolipid hydroxylase (fatty acid hydroxylase superfamily)